MRLFGGRCVVEESRGLPASRVSNPAAMSGPVLVTCFTSTPSASSASAGLVMPSRATGTSPAPRSGCVSAIYEWVHPSSMTTRGSPTVSSTATNEPSRSPASSSAGSPSMPHTASSRNGCSPTMPSSTSDHRAEALSHWLHYYNTRRPHSSLGGRPPISRVHNLPRQDS
jgi:hypothetical protein